MSWWVIVALVLFWSAVLGTAGVLGYRKVTGRTPSRPVTVPHAHELTRYGDTNLSRQPGGG